MRPNVADEARRPTRTALLKTTASVVAAVYLPAIGGCGGGTTESPPPPPPATISLSVSGNASVEEAENPKVQVNVKLDAPARGSIGVRLHFAGTAERDRDYEVGADSFTIPNNATSATAEVDVYRDFEEEGDEIIEVSVGAFTGSAQLGEASSVTLTVLDGDTATVDKTPPLPPESSATLLPLLFGVTEDAIMLVVIALAPPDATVPLPLVAEWSTDIDFDTDVHMIGAYEIAPITDPFDLFLGSLRQFLLPLADLAPNGNYFVRVHLGKRPSNGLEGLGPDVYLNGFATSADGLVTVRCEAPHRTPDTRGVDPLFAEQWHLRNTGQTAFSDRGGIAGADLRMAEAIDAGRNGAGVKLAIVDTGLEICHPDLAANTAVGGSFNFGFLGTPGASPGDPFNFSTLGDHGTSVAGIAAAAANNGYGGRGVAPEVTLVGFNPIEAAGDPEDDPEAAAPTAMLQSLGASDRNPDSASVDIFNMSFGYEAPSENSQEEWVRLFRMGSEQLRSGRGALYVKAAGNQFDACDQVHPFNREVGCFSSNSDPDQNLPWLTVVGGFNAHDVRSSYSSAGANLWVVGPSGEDGAESPAMITTDQAGTLSGFSQFVPHGLTSEHTLNRDGDYVSAFGGTSSAAPAVAGAIAVLLDVNPDLTWRDVKHILANSARTIDPDIAEVRAAFNGTPYVAQHAWQANAAGYGFHNWYGFGAVDVDAAVEMASGYAPANLGAFVESEWFDASVDADMPLAIPDVDGAGISVMLEVAGMPVTANIEAVVLEIAVEHTNALDLGVTLRSAAGTASVVNPPLNTLLEGFEGMHDWHLLSNAFYGENPNGEWTVHVADIAAEDTGSLVGWRLRFYYGEHPGN
ncbi:MAG: S8 family serine peptidase [Gammaproteobacteria bacterium]|nr:S8 family serine peptidase [Gammaproteobacteria bacterium]